MVPPSDVQLPGTCNLRRGSPNPQGRWLAPDGKTPFSPVAQSARPDHCGDSRGPGSGHPPLSSEVWPTFSAERGARCAPSSRGLPKAARLPGGGLTATPRWTMRRGLWRSRTEDKGWVPKRPEGQSPRHPGLLLPERDIAVHLHGGAQVSA